MRYLGIDYGTKKTGISVSDESGSMAFPHSVLSTDKYLLQTITDIITEENIKGIIVGESRDLGGGLNTVAENTQNFIQSLIKLVPKNMEIHYVDERYTTKMARNAPVEGLARGEVSNKRGGTKRPGQADAQAAALILQTYLDKRRNLS